MSRHQGPAPGRPSEGPGYTAARSISQSRIPHVPEGTGNPMTAPFRGAVEGRIRALPLGSADLSSASPSANPVGRHERASHHDAARNAGSPRDEDDACRRHAPRHRHGVRERGDRRGRNVCADAEADRRSAERAGGRADALPPRLAPADLRRSGPAQGLHPRGQRCDAHLSLARARPAAGARRRRAARRRALRLHRRAHRRARSAAEGRLERTRQKRTRARRALPAADRARRRHRRREQQRECRPRRRRRAGERRPAARLHERPHVHVRRRRLPGARRARLRTGRRRLRRRPQRPHARRPGRDGRAAARRSWRRAAGPSRCAPTSRWRATTS